MTSLAIKTSQRLILLTEKYDVSPCDRCLPERGFSVIAILCMFKHFVPKYLFQFLAHISIAS